MTPGSASLIVLSTTVRLEHSHMPVLSALQGQPDPLGPPSGNSRLRCQVRHLGPLQECRDCAGAQEPTLAEPLGIVQGQGLQGRLAFGRGERNRHFALGVDPDFVGQLE
jgi:hypothetical protein